MNPWLETIGVTLLALAGAGLGWWISSWRRPYWLLGYFLPLAIILIMGLGRRFPALAFHAPFVWLMTGRTPFVVIALVTPLVLTTPLSRLPSPRQRRWVVLLMVVFVSYASVWPFAASALNRNYLATLLTQIDEDGICRQSTSYSCGPAAAVTALRRLGLPAEEGELAILAHTSDAMGTPPDILCQVLQTKYQADGLKCELKQFKSLDELRQAGLTLAVIKFGLLVDHYQVVLEVTDRYVIVGDPSFGKQALTHAAFLKKWRFIGVVLHDGSIEKRN